MSSIFVAASDLLYRRGLEQTLAIAGRKRLLHLLLIMVVVCAGFGAAAIYLLNDAAFATDDTSPSMRTVTLGGALAFVVTMLAAGLFGRLTDSLLGRLLDS